MRERLHRLFRRTAEDSAAEVDEELEFHLAMRAADLVRSGLDPAAARRRARDEFGDLEFTRAYCLRLDRREERVVRIAEWFDDWRHDVTQSWRAVRRSPGFALIALLTLALAIGANTAIFSVVRAVLFRPLPFGHPERLVSVTETDPASATARNPLSALNLLDYRAGARQLAGIAGYDGRSVTWRPASGAPELLDVLSVTGNTFEVLEAPPLLGRTLTPSDGEPGTEPRAVLSWQWWRRAFGSDPSIVGRTITLNDLPYRVVGVMPEGFSIGGGERMWVPLGFAREQADPAVSRRQHYIKTIARLGPGVTLEAATAELGRISRELETSYPDANAGRIAVLTPLHEAMTGDLRPSLWLLQMASGLLLLIATINLANLTLARGLTRRREMALRAALGAGRSRLMRQLLAESVGLSLAGGLAGMGLAVFLTRALLSLEPAAVPALFPVGPDRTVLAFGLGLSLLTGLGFGVLPAFEAARTDLRGALQDGGRHASGHGTGRTRRVLVVAQVALAAVLLAGAGLMLRSFSALLDVPLGFDPGRVLTVEVRVSGERYDPPARVNGFYDRVLDRLAGAPGIVAVGATMKLPTRGMATSSLRIDGAANDPTRLPDIGLVLVRGDYFSVLGVPLIAGRLFGPEDRVEAPGVVVLNQTAARTFFPGGDAIGRRVRLGPDADAPWSTIIGVVGDMREQSLEEPPRPVAYASHVQNTWWRSLVLTVRTAGDPAAAAPLIRAAVREADPTLAVRNVETLTNVVGDNLRARRFALGLVAGFAGVALLLAAVGIYGVLAFMVSSRTREFGVRLALGAERRSVLLLVLRQGLGWALLGLVLGIGGALAGGRLLEGRLYGVLPTDALTFGLTGAGLLLVAVLACVVPAARATRVDPIRSLRQD